MIIIRFYRRRCRLPLLAAAIGLAGLFASPGVPASEQLGSTTQAARAQEAMQSLGLAPTSEKTAVGEKLQGVSTGGDGKTTMTVVIASSESQAREIYQAIVGLYKNPAYSPGEFLEVGLAEKAVVFRTLGSFQSRPPNWVASCQVSGHFLCGNIYAAVTQERTGTTVYKELNVAEAAGGKLSAQAKPQVEAVLKQLAGALQQRGACQP